MFSVYQCLNLPADFRRVFWIKITKHFPDNLIPSGSVKWEENPTSFSFFLMRGKVLCFRCSVHRVHAETQLIKIWFTRLDYVSALVVQLFYWNGFFKIAFYLDQGPASVFTSLSEIYGNNLIWCSLLIMLRHASNISFSHDIAFSKADAAYITRFSPLNFPPSAVIWRNQKY